MKIRTVKSDDYQNLISFWKSHYFVNEMDNLERFKLFLKKNPNLSLIADDKGKIVGTALGSFDGRRGYIQKLVVHRDFRKTGIGKALIDEILIRFNKLDILYVPINCDVENIGFYKKCGFKKTKQVPMNINL